MEAALVNLTTAQIKDLLVQASWKVKEVKAAVIAANESVKAKRRERLPANFEMATEAIRRALNTLLRCPYISLVGDDEQRASYRSIAEGILQIVQQSVDCSTPYETKILAIQCLIDQVGITSDSVYRRFFEVTMKQGVPEGIVDAVFKVRKTLTADEIDVALRDGHIFKHASHLLCSLRERLTAQPETGEALRICVSSSVLLRKCSSSGRAVTVPRRLCKVAHLPLDRFARAKVDKARRVTKHWMRCDET